MERIYPNDVHPYVWADHIHRYKWASQFAKGVVLDFACGVGYGSTYIFENPIVEKYIGADLNFEAIQIACKDYRFAATNFLTAHSERLPFQKHSFDTIICFETLEHLDNPEWLLEQFANLLREDGVIIGSVPTKQQEELISKIYGENTFHKTKFDFVRLNRLLGKYFNKSIYFKQSLEVGSLLIPFDLKNIESRGKIIEDVTLPGPEHGNLLFVGTPHSGIPYKLQAQISFTPSISLFKVDENYNNNLHNLEKRISELSDAKSRLEEDLEKMHNQSIEEMKRMIAEKEQLEEDLEKKHNQSIEEMQRMIAEKEQLEGDLEKMRNQSVEEIERMNGEKKRLEEHVHLTEINLNRLKEQVVTIESDNQSLLNTLHEIERSRYWRLIKWLWSQPMYLNLRKIFFKGNESFINYPELKESNPTKPLSSELENTVVIKQKSIFQQGKQLSRKESFSKEEINWIEDVRTKKVEAICVLHPEWRGIHASAEQMFDVLLEIPDNLDPQSAYHFATLLSETNCKKIVMSGFPVSYRYLVIALREHFPEIKILVIFHGQYNQYREDYDRLSYSTMLNLAKAGKVDKLGFVKAGMPEVIAAGTGVRTSFLMNWVEQVPQKASSPLEGGPHLGMWLLWSGNWRKPPFTMLASSLLIPGSIIHGSDSDEQMQEYIQLMNIQAEFAGRPLLHHELKDALASMHVNLYVTFHECAPMLPLESLSVGAPCIFGPVSHYFEDETYLHKRLVVPYPDRAEVVAEYAMRAMEERDQIIEHYKEYAPNYNQQAHHMLSEFLNY
jgi:SAM-dependent methyltransferase